MTELNKFQKYPEPDDIINETIQKGFTDFYVGYSGGKDSGVVLDILSKNFPDYFKGVFFVDTGIGTKATIDFVSEYCSDRNYPLFVIKPENVKRKKGDEFMEAGEPYSYEKLVTTKGFPHQAVHTITMRVLKYFPMRKFINDRYKLGEKPCIVSGIRKHESARRKINAKNHIFTDGKLTFVSPIMYKHDEWVYKYFLEHDIKRSPVYETLHISGDCLCGCFAKKDELKLLEMFHPEVFEKIKKLEKQIECEGTSYAKKYSTWGNGQMTEDIEAQTTMESFVCTDCLLDRKMTDEDTERFDDDFNDIQKKLDKL